VEQSGLRVVDRGCARGAGPEQGSESAGTGADDSASSAAGRARRSDSGTGRTRDALKDATARLDAANAALTQLRADMEHRLRDKDDEIDNIR